MPYYSEDIIEEVRSGNDIVDVISGYVQLHKKGNTHFGLCPFHNEKSPSFSVSAGKQLYYCFGCGAGGNVFTFLMEYENYTFREALIHLAERIGYTLPTVELSNAAKQEADVRTQILKLNKLAATYYYAQLQQKQGSIALNYLKTRQLTDETIQKFGLGYSNKYSDDLYKYLKEQGYEDDILKDSGLISFDEKRGGHDKFWNRVMFPIMDQNKKVIGFGGRVMGDGEPKYLNSPETKVFDKSRNLYGIQQARASKKSSLLLCEGYMDVIALNQAGFQNAVASLGTAFTQGHANLIKRYSKEVYLTFDSDEAGRRAALRAIPILKEAGITVKIINMEPYKDPDDFIKKLGAEAFKERITNAMNSFMYEISVIEQNYNLKDPEEKTGFYNETARKILEFDEEIERNNYIEAFAAKYQVSYDSYKKLVYNVGSRGVVPKSKPIKTVKKDKRKESVIKHSQKLLITWLIEDNSLFDKIKPYIGPDDFTEEIYQKTAELLFEQYEKNDINSAKIVNMFQDKDQQREVAALFNASLKDINTQHDREKALKDTIVHIKQNSFEIRFKNLDTTNIEEMQKWILCKKQQEELQNLHISIN